MPRQSFLRSSACVLALCMIAGTAAANGPDPQGAAPFLLDDGRLDAVTAGVSDSCSSTGGSCSSTSSAGPGAHDVTVVRTFTRTSTRTRTFDYAVTVNGRSYSFARSTD